jgi:hypothetical protein
VAKALLHLHSAPLCQRCSESTVDEASTLHGQGREGVASAHVSGKQSSTVTVSQYQTLAHVRRHASRRVASRTGKAILMPS